MTKIRKIYLENFSEINFCGNKAFTFTGNEYILPSPIEPTEGEHNFESCEKCVEHKESLIKKFKESIDDFPNCCDSHKGLLNFSDFKKKDFEGIEEDIANKLMYSHHHIINNIEKDDWYEDICNYIKYAVESFGTFPPHYGQPFQLGNYFIILNNLIDNFIKTEPSKTISKKLRNNRLKKVKAYLDIYTDTDNDKGKKDLNLLLSTYDKWFSIFPFDLIYFQHLKLKFKKTIPVFNGESDYNKYSKKTSFKIHTKESLTQHLIVITKQIITTINGAKLYEQNLLSNAEKIQLDLLLQNRKLELSEINEMDNNDRNSYMKTLKKWFKTEKNFIKDITPFLKSNQSKTNDVDAKLSINQIALKYVYENKVVTRENCNKIVKEFGHNSGEKLFQKFTYYSSTANRKGKPVPLTEIKLKNKIRLIDSVIELIPEKVKQRAVDEVGILKTLYKNEFE